MARPEPNVDSLRTLLRLIDDETPEVRSSVFDAIDVYEGDVSELLPEAELRSPVEREILSDLLLPGRRRRLRRDWIVPEAGAHALGDDWERFESLLRVLSDYLHDGIALRQPLGDALDLLAEEAEPVFLDRGEAALCRHLLCGDRFPIRIGRDPDPLHLDLARVLEGGETNALALGLVVLLVAQRLGAQIVGINLPGAFFCRIGGEGSGDLIDPAQGGKTLDPGEFSHRIRRYPRDVRLLAARAASPGELLLRVTNDLTTAFAVLERDEDALLMEDLFGSLLPGQ